MKSIIPVKRIALAAVLASAICLGNGTFSHAQTDASEATVVLPTTTINGRECFYYKPKNSSETVYGLSKRLGLTREEIVAYNPGVADGIRKGTTLYFPVEDFRDRIVSEDSGNASKSRELNPPRATVSRPQVQEAGSSSSDGQVSVPQYYQNPLTPPVRPTLAAASEDEATPYTIAVIMPFMLNKEDMQRPAKLVTDFYRGMLIAADTLSTRGDSVTIMAFDSEGNPSRLAEILAGEKVKKAAAVVLSSSPEALAAAADAGLKGNVFNVLNFSDTLYLENSNFIQANIPHDAMYHKAVDVIISNLGDVTPVILSNSEGRNDKEAFTAYLRERLNATTKRYVEIAYDGTLTSSDLEVLLADSEGKYCVIPSAGSISEFNRFAHALRNFKVTYPGVQLDVFGYPEWTTFRGEALDMLHTLQATIYSRFSCDYSSFSARTVNQDFRSWYGAPMIESVPSQGLMGYDTGCYIIKNLRANRGLLNPAHPADFRGIQSSFRFVRAENEGGEDGGWVNEALYIIHFKPLTGLDITVL